MISRPFQICIVGMPARAAFRCSSACARTSAVAAAAAAAAADRARGGPRGSPAPGAVWRTDQSRHLLMNTVASQVTVYTDESARIDGPIEPGPEPVRVGGGDRACSGGLGGLEDWVTEPRPAAARARLVPHPRVLRPVPDRLLPPTSWQRTAAQRRGAGAPHPGGGDVRRARPIAGGHQGVRLEDGTRLNEPGRAGARAGSRGLPRIRPRVEERTAALARIHFLTYIHARPVPADVDLGFGSRPGQNVLVRGLGLNFFDYMALLTLGRGGRFERARASACVYRPSGSRSRCCSRVRAGACRTTRGARTRRASFGRYFPSAC
jgi:hypothetical protein